MNINSIINQMGLELMNREKRILIVDDNHDFREQLSQHLLNSFKRNETSSLVERVKATLHASSKVDERDFTPEPYVIHTASQGQQAYEMVQNALAQGKPYALIFLDIRMPPGWDGVITLEHIWKVDKKVQVVLCSAHSVYSWKEVVERFGKKDNLLILKKPFDTTVVSQIALALTEKYIVEQQEDDSDEYLKHIINGLPAPLIITDNSGKVKYWNSATEELTGINAADSCERALWDILPGLEKCGQDIKEVIQTQEDISREGYISIGGKSQKVDITVYPLTKDADGAAAIIRVLRREASDEALTETEYLKTIYSITEAINILKNDLNLDGNDEEQLKDKLKQDIEKLEKVAKNSESIIMKALSRNSSSISTEINNAIHDCKNILDDIKVSIDMDNENSDCAVPGGQLKLCLWNILVNAAEAIKPAKTDGHISIKVDKVNIVQPMSATMPQADPGTYWLIKISDNGVGMDNNTVARIFDPFFTTKSNCGLGLVLVYNILKQYNGHIMVESEENKGSVFSLYLPVK